MRMHSWTDKPNTSKLRRERPSQKAQGRSDIAGTERIEKEDEVRGAQAGSSISTSGMVPSSRASGKSCCATEKMSRENRQVSATESSSRAVKRDSNAGATVA